VSVLEHELVGVRLAARWMQADLLKHDRRRDDPAGEYCGETGALHPGGLEVEQLLLAGQRAARG
jgi:hypothetical protein